MSEHIDTSELAVIALGSNLNGPLQQLRQATQELTKLGEVVVRSSLYKTAPVGGPPGQAPYLNAVIGLRPNAALNRPERLLEALLELEQAHGRERRVRWGPRTLDLDLLLFGNHTLRTAELTLPHPRMTERAFVLVPLCETLPELSSPLTGKRFCAHLGTLDLTGVIKTNLVWHS